MSRITKKICLLSIIYYLLFMTSTYAYELSIEFPGVTKTISGPADYIISFYKFALLIVGLMAMAMIVFGAIEYTVSAGNSARQSDAKDRITQAIWGVILLLGAYLILTTLNPSLVALKEQEPTLTPINKESKSIYGSFNTQLNELSQQLKEESSEITKQNKDLYKKNQQLENDYNKLDINDPKREEIAEEMQNNSSLIIKNNERYFENKDKIGHAEAVMETNVKYNMNEGYIIIPQKKESETTIRGWEIQGINTIND